MVKQVKQVNVAHRRTRRTPADARYGLQNINELMPRVMDRYGMESDRQQDQRPLNPAVATITLTTAPTQQTTFGWE